MARLLANLLACGLAASVCTGLEAQNGDEPRELTFDSESLTLDRKTNLIELKGPRIRQGNIHIEADTALATGIDFAAQSEWQFMGNVRITVDNVVIEAESAVFTFVDEQLARGELQGQPASFADVDPARDGPVRGGANRLSYDYLARTLRMTESAWVNKDQYEIQGCDLVYDFTDERVTSGSSDCGELFRIRVLSQPDDSTSPADAPQ